MTPLFVEWPPLAPLPACIAPMQSAPLITRPIHPAKWFEESWSWKDDAVRIEAAWKNEPVERRCIGWGGRALHGNLPITPWQDSGMTVPEWEQDTARRIAKMYTGRLVNDWRTYRARILNYLAPRVGPIFAEWFDLEATPRPEGCCIPKLDTTDEAKETRCLKVYTMAASIARVPIESIRQRMDREPLRSLRKAIEYVGKRTRPRYSVCFNDTHGFDLQPNGWRTFGNCGGCAAVSLYDPGKRDAWIAYTQDQCRRGPTFGVLPLIGWGGTTADDIRTYIRQLPGVTAWIIWNGPSEAYPKRSAEAEAATCAAIAEVVA